MAGQGNANTGRLNLGDLESDAAWESLAGEIARENGQETMADAREAEGAQNDLIASFGEGQREAEAELQDYLNRAKARRGQGFAPMETLTARLAEFASPTRSGAAAAGVLDGITGWTTATAETTPSRAGGIDLAWFDQRFAELKRLFANRDEEKREIVSINTRLAEIIERVDRMSAAMPAESTMLALQGRLATVSQSLDAARQQSAADADRISRAAKEILAAGQSAQDARAGFETAARHTVRELGKTVVIASSRAAFMTAEHVASAWQPAIEQGVYSRVEGELRALNEQSRRSTEKTEAAVEKVSDALRTFLEKGGGAQGASSQPRRRVGVHMPISADAPIYSHSNSGFGSSPAEKPKLDAITLRPPRPPDPNLVIALQEAGEKLGGKSPQGGNQLGTDGEDDRSPSDARLFREEERSLPLVGISIVAAVLLLASVALYYLHTRTHLVPFHLSLATQSESVSSGERELSPAEDEDLESAPGREPEAAYSRAPALFASADQTQPDIAPAQDDAANDWQALTDAARKGDREAQYRIGTRFLNEGGAHGDPAAAARWLERAAEQGHVEALFKLATLYERGEGVEKDEAKAIELYRKAAQARHPLAMHNLGVLLAAHDTPKDYREAARWFAEANLPESQFNLALLYERGLGVPRDLKMAYSWYLAAARSGDSEATQQAERLKRTIQAGGGLVSPEIGAWQPSLEGTWQASALKGSR